MQTFILSLLQSITEFLPVSSSGHLIILPALMGWKAQGIAVDIGLHLGTLLAVCVYFFPDLWKMLIDLFNGKNARKQVFLLGLASVPIAIIGFFAGHYVEEVRYPYVICVTLIVFGIVLWWVDKVSESNRTLDDISYKDAFLIGLAQCLALIPGTSRSGITMTTARLCKINRSDAAKFSMLLSIPVIGAAGAWLFMRLFIHNRLDVLDAQFFESILYSFIGGLLVIRFLMSFVKKHSFFAFMVYRIFLGIFLFLFLSI